MPFTDNETLQNFYFTNIFQEADNGTTFYHSQMLEQQEKFTVDKLPDILLQTYSLPTQNSSPMIWCFD